MLREVYQRLSYMSRVLTGVELEDVGRLFITPSNNDNCSGSQPVPLGRSLRAEEEGYIGHVKHTAKCLRKPDAKSSAQSVKVTADVIGDVETV